MRAVIVHLVSAALAFAMAGCTTLTNGVVDKPIANDERLIGTWVDPDRNPGEFLLIVADSPTSLAITGTDCRKTERIIAIRTQIENRDFLDLADSEGKFIALGPISYEFISPDRFSVFGPDGDAFAHAVENNELAGKITKPSQPNQSPSVEVQASTAELRQWISRHPAAMIHGKPLEFIRRDPATAPHCDPDRPAMPHDRDENPPPPTKP